MRVDEADARWRRALSGSPEIEFERNRAGRRTHAAAEPEDRRVKISAKVYGRIVPQVLQRDAVCCRPIKLPEPKLRLVTVAGPLPKSTPTVRAPANLEASRCEAPKSQLMLCSVRASLPITLMLKGSGCPCGASNMFRSLAALPAVHDKADGRSVWRRHGGEGYGVAPPSSAYAKPAPARTARHRKE